MGVDDVKNQLVGALVYPVFVELTLYVTNLIDFGNLEMIVVAVIAGFVLESLADELGFVYMSISFVVGILAKQFLGIDV